MDWFSQEGTERTGGILGRDQKGRQSLKSGEGRNSEKRGGVYDHEGGKRAQLQGRGPLEERRPETEKGGKILPICPEIWSRNGNWGGGKTSPSFERKSFAKKGKRRSPKEKSGGSGGKGERKAFAPGGSHGKKN